MIILCSGQVISQWKTIYSVILSEEPKKPNLSFSRCYSYTPFNDTSESLQSEVQTEETLTVPVFYLVQFQKAVLND